MQLALCHCSHITALPVNLPNFLVLDWEFVVISYFFPDGDWLLGIDNNFAGAINFDDLRITIWLQKLYKYKTAYNNNI